MMKGAKYSTHHERFTVVYLQRIYFATHSFSLLDNNNFKKSSKIQFLSKMLNICESVWSVLLRSVQEPAVSLESWQDKYQEAGGGDDSSSSDSQRMSGERVCVCVFARESVWIGVSNCMCVYQHVCACCLLMCTRVCQTSGLTSVFEHLHSTLGSKQQLPNKSLEGSLWK